MTTLHDYDATKCREPDDQGEPPVFDPNDAPCVPTELEFRRALLDLVREKIELQRRFDDVTAERDRMRPVFDAAVAFHEALKDENNDCISEHHALFGAVVLALNTRGA